MSIDKEALALAESVALAAPCTKGEALSALAIMSAPEEAREEGIRMIRQQGPAEGVTVKGVIRALREMLERLEDRMEDPT